MRLNDILRVCLLSLASRYPIHTIDLDDDVMTIPEIDTRGWIAQEVIEFLDSYAPHLLQTPASLLVDECNSEIFLLLYSDDRPALHVHCRGKIPAPRKHLVEKREEVPSGVGLLMIRPPHAATGHSTSYC